MTRAFAVRSTLTVCVCILLLTTSPAYATDCGNLPGTREATASDDVVKNGQVTAGTCYNPNDTHIGTKDESAKAYLKSLPRTGSATDDKNIAGLNDSFAMCAAKFLKDFSQRYGGVTISSAYRSSESEAIMCRNNPACGRLMNNPNPQGNHQRGLAMDVWQGTQGSSDNAKIRDFAQQNPQYGVCFPFAVPNTGFYDRPHMILAGGPGSEGNGAGCRGVTRACDGSNFNPNEVRTSSAGPVGASAYTGGTNVPAGSNPFASPYNPTQQSQMCVVSTDPIIVVPCNQVMQQYPQPQPQTQIPMPNYPQSPQQNAYPISTGGTSAQAGTVSQADPRFTPSFPLPTPNGTSFTPPSQYTYAPSTDATVSPSSYSAVSKTGTPTSSIPVRTTAPTKLNTDLQNVTGIEESVGYTTTGGVVINTTSQANSQAALPRATETFTRTEPTKVAAPVPATSSVSANNTLIIATLTALRNLLVSYAQLLKTKSSVGFQGSWQLPGHTYEY